MDPHPFERIFAPRAVAVVGAGAGVPAAERVLANLAAGGFAGTLHAIGAAPAAGARAAGSLAEAEGPVDLAVIAAPPEERLAAVAACAERGVAGAILLPVPVSAGQVDPSPEALRATARGVRLFGPKSLGLIRPGACLQASFTSSIAAPGKLALVSQSGAICAAMLDWAAAHRLGFSTVVSLGQAADVDLGEALEYLALDPDTWGILLYVEQVRSARAFLSGLRIAARIKPVIVVRAGAHGGASPAADDAFDAALARAGAVRVPHLGQMYAAARLLARRQATLAGHRLAILGNARGPALLAADRAAELGVAVPPLSAATVGKLAAALPVPPECSNPLDLLHDAGAARYREAVAACLADPEVDAVLAILAPQALSEPEPSADALAVASAGARKPVIACWMGEEGVRHAWRVLEQAGIPVLPTPDRAVEAFGHLASYGRNQRLLRQVPEPLAPGAMPQVDLARDVVRGALARRSTGLTTAELRKLLATVGVRDRLAAGSRVTGTELCVSVERDPTFGPVIRFGRGSAAGPVGERVVAIPPLDTAIIQTLTRSSRIASLFTPAGGMPPPAVAAFERTLWAVSELVSEVPELVALEICPLVAAGEDVYASGARAVLAPLPEGAGRYAHMAIHPYPSELRTRWQLPDGSAVTIRPIRPEDAELEASFVRNLSDNARHFRFMVGLRELPREMLIRFTQIDYDRELALLALVERGGRETEIAVVRYAQTGPDSADIAIVVADEWQGKGLGRRLLVRTMDIARSRGIVRLEGEMLAENLPIRRLLASLDFTFHRDPEGGDIVLFERSFA